MRFVLVAAALLTAQSAMAERKTVTRATGEDVIIQGSVTPCVMPDPIPPREQSSPIYEVSTQYVENVCRQYRTYDVDVTGKFWNTKETEIPGTSITSYKLETDTQTVSESVQSVESKDGTYHVTEGEWARGVMQLGADCQIRFAQAEAQARPVPDTGCN